MRALFESLGVHVLDGGPTLNPSTYDLLAAIHAVPAEEVVVLPNSPNVLMAAERAAELSDKTVARRAARARSRPDWRRRSASIPTAAPPRTRRRWPRRSSTCAPARSRPPPATTPRAASAPVTRSGSSRRSSSPGDPPRRRCATCSSSWPQDAELITCLRGADAPLDDAAVHALVDGGVELELSEGGQPSYWWLLSAE